MLSRDQLIRSCQDNNITCLMCGQGYEATEEDVLNDNPELAPDNDDAQYPSPDAQKARDLKEAVMIRMLPENLDFGPLMETDDEDERDDHPERMEARADIVEVIAERWVSGSYTGKTTGKRKRKQTELELAQADCDALVAKWYGSELLDELVEALWDTGETIKSERIAEYVGRTKIAEFFAVTSAKNADEFVEECSTGFSGTPIDGSPFTRDDSDAYAREYWDAHV